MGGQPWKVEYNEVGLQERGLAELLGVLLDERDPEGQETDGWGDKKLITDVVWMGDHAVFVSETNRVSDHYRGVLVDVQTQSATVVRDEKISDGWFEIVCYLNWGMLILVALHDLYSCGSGTRKTA